MKYIISGHEFQYEAFTIIQSFFPVEHHEQADSLGEGYCILSTLECGNTSARLYKDGAFLRVSIDAGDDVKNAIKRSIYNVLSEETGRTQPWGILTGIRPAKIARKLLEEGRSRHEIIRHFGEKYFCSQKKAALAVNVAQKERELLKGENQKGVYIGVPFCPTKCLYCSFTSYSIDKYRDYIDGYLNAVFAELDYAANYLHGSRLESVYIGGGTPTSLGEKDFYKLMSATAKRLNIKEAAEFCVEAGRPDTITKDKLSIMKDMGVNRISINPQTMKQATLKLIGRSHTVKDFLYAYEMAVFMGFTNINIDLIMGLPGETLSDIHYTFLEVSKLKPKNVTVHSLSVKRASALKENYNMYKLAEAEEIDSFLTIAESYMDNCGLEPYYLYRQKNIAGNFENVGYAIPGYESLYNVKIMEETQDIIGIGPAAVTKYVNLSQNRIERAFNVKEPSEYIGRIGEMIERKRKLEESIC